MGLNIDMTISPLSQPASDWSKAAIGGRFSRLPLEEQTVVLSQIASLLLSSKEEIDYFSKVTPFISPILVKKVFLLISEDVKCAIIDRIFRLFASSDMPSPQRRQFINHLADLKRGINVFDYQIFAMEHASQILGGCMGLESHHQGVSGANFPVILPFSKSNSNPRIHDEDLTTLLAGTSHFGKYGKIDASDKAQKSEISFEDFYKEAFACKFAGNPEQITTHLIKSLNSRKRLIYLLQTLLENEEAIQEIARRSYWHDLGKLRIPLILVGDLSVVLHIWECSPQFNENDEYRHNHHASFASYIALGRVEHFLYKSRCASDSEIALFRDFCKKLETLDDQMKKCILFSLRDIHSSGQSHPIYDSIINDHLLGEAGAGSTNNYRTLLMDKKQLAQQLRMNEEQVEVVAGITPSYLTTLGEGLESSPDYLVLKPPMIDYLQSGDSYFLSGNLIHKFIANSNLSPTVTLVVRKGRTYYSSMLKAQLSIEKPKRKRIENPKDLIERLQQLISKLQTVE